MPTYGTQAVADLMATDRSLVDIPNGERETLAALQALLVAHENLVDQKINTLVETTTDRQRRYGGTDTMTLAEVDEFGTADAQKAFIPGSNVGFPLRKFQRAVQWTYTAFEIQSPADILKLGQALMDADARNMDLAIRRALFRPINYTFTDRFVDRVDLAVKALVNADGAPIPPDAYGNTFDAATHTHYLATATLTAANVDNLIGTVVEHYVGIGGRAQLWINTAQEPAIRAFTAPGQFYGLLPADIIAATNANQVRGSLDPNQTFNKWIGVWGYNSAQVWVKPWIPPGYMFAWMEGGPKPLVRRIRNARNGAFRLVYEDEVHPLRARVMEREFGLGIYNRTNGAILMVGAGTYAEPNLVA